MIRLHLDEFKLSVYEAVESDWGQRPSIWAYDVFMDVDGRYGRYGLRDDDDDDGKLPTPNHC